MTYADNGLSGALSSGCKESDVKQLVPFRVETRGGPSAAVALAGRKGATNLRVTPIFPLPSCNSAALRVRFVPIKQAFLMWLWPTGRRHMLSGHTPSTCNFSLQYLLKVQPA